jgi:hypothetical protein
MLPVFKKGKDRLVHLCFNIRPHLLVNDPMDVTAVGGQLNSFLFGRGSI